MDLCPRGTGYTGLQALIVGTVSFLYALWVSPGSRNPGPPLGQPSLIDRDGDGHRARREDSPPYGSGDGPPVPGAGNVRTQRVTCGMRLEAVSTSTTAVPAAGPGSPVRVRATHAEAKPSNTLSASARPADAQGSASPCTAAASIASAPAASGTSSAVARILVRQPGPVGVTSTTQAGRLVQGERRGLAASSR